MSREGMSIWVAVCAVWAAGCGISAPETPDGTPVELLLLVDDGIQDATKPPEQEDRKTLAAWMSKELTLGFTEAGYTVRPAETPADFIPSPKVYLVVVTLDALKIEELYTHNETRLGDGVTTITTTVELFKDNHTLPIMRHTETFLSSRDWTYSAAELNRKMSTKVSDRINDLY